MIAATLLLALVAATQPATQPVTQTAPAPATLGSLAWMTGAWGAEIGGIQMEEVWLAPRGGVMLGLHRDVKGERLLIFEFLRIEETTSGLVYQAQPRGRPPVPFPMVETGPQRVVFANPQHDFPQRILYWLGDDGALHARVEGPAGGKESAEEWAWPPRARLD